MSEKYLIIHKKYLFLCKNYFVTSKKYLFILKIFVYLVKNIWSWTKAYLDTVCRAPSRCCGKPCSGPGPSPSCAGCCPPGWCSPQCAAERPYSRKSCIIFSNLSNIFQPGGHPHHGVCAVLPLRPGELPHVQAAAVAQPAIEIKISHQIFFLCSKYFLPPLPAPDAVCALGHWVAVEAQRVVVLHEDVEAAVIGVPGMPHLFRGSSS